MRLRFRFVIPTALTLLATACGGGDKSSGNDAPATNTPPPPPPPAAAKPPAADPKPVTPKPMPPFETIKFTQAADKEHGWPKFDAVNLGDKKLAFAAITGFAYDKGGKLVKRTATPLSWNSTIAPGDKATFPISIGAFEKENVTADVFELCYDSIKYDGDDKFVEDKTLCTDARPMGGVKSKGEAAGSSAPSAGAKAGRGGKGHGKRK